MKQTTTTPADLQLADEFAACYADPLRFVKIAYPWGESGSLREYKGPDAWQESVLRDIGAQVRQRAFDGVRPVAPIRLAVASGHGIGKSVLCAWLVNWIMSTRPRCQGTVTANTFPQLASKTWPAIQRWTSMSINAHWWKVGASTLQHKELGSQWSVSAQTCREENSESFAGQHAATSTSFYIFDESSSVPDAIWEVAEGGLTDGEPMIFAFGNPTRSHGKFHRVTFGTERERWSQRSIDSRDCAFTNKVQIAEWIQDYGEDSDFVRVRVRGLPPSASDLQYIDADRVYAAQKRQPICLPDDPLVAGLDVARGGGDNCAIRFRRGADGASIPPIKIPGEQARDSMRLVSVATDVLAREYPGGVDGAGVKVKMLFVDETGIGGPIVDRIKQLGFSSRVLGVNFGSKPPDGHYANMRSWMWSQMRDWLTRGSIDKDTRLETDLTGPGYFHDKQDRLLLESKEDLKKRGLDSPDDGDALCFVADTAVQTTRGAVPIQFIQVGDRVVTPFGASPVMAVHISNALTLTDVHFSNGSRLVGKGEHEIFTFSSGKVRLDALSLTNEVEIISRWRLALWRIVSLCSTEARSSGFKRLADTFSPGTRMHRRDFFTAGSGSTITALFRKAKKSIISMTTGGITPSETSVYDRLAFTSGNICWYGPLIRAHGNAGWNTSRLGERRPPSGTVHQRGSLGIASTVNAPGRTGAPLMRSVPGAGVSTRPSSQADPSTVRRLAPKLSVSGVISRKLDIVRSAAKTLWLTVIGRRPVVPVSVQTASAPPTLTYNLTLENHNAYYANGILVFNCLTFAAPVGPERKQESPRLVYNFGDRSGGGWMA